MAGDCASPRDASGGACAGAVLVDMSAVFEVRIERDSRVVVSGDLDLATAPQLMSAVESLAATGARRVVVDLGAVSFIDSSGISALLRADQTLREADGVLVLGAMSAQVMSVLAMTGLQAEFVREGSSG